MSRYIYLIFKLLTVLEPLGQPKNSIIAMLFYRDKINFIYLSSIYLCARHFNRFFLALAK